MLLAYRLDGADDKWTVSTGTHQVEYRGLTSGSYTFELRAYGRAQPDTWKDARLSFVVTVVWYRSLWFYIMVLPSLAAIFLLFYMLHLQRIRGRFKLILEERTRLAREMHDTLIQGCNGVAMLLEADASSRGKLIRSGLWHAQRSTLEGNYNGTPQDPVLPIDALRAALRGTDVDYAQGAPFVDGFSLPVSRSMLHPGAGSAEEGLKGEYFSHPSFEGTPVKSVIDPQDLTLTPLQLCRTITTASWECTSERR
jgi:Y_Y_Y domain/Histidine kinase